MLRAILLLFFALILIESKAEVTTSAFLFSEISISADSASTKQINKANLKRKANAIGLAIALGPFGMHRLYLGTDYRVPLFYSLTLGAFGILPLIDVVAIIATKEISDYENNPKMIMWIK